MTAHELTHTIRNDMPVYPGTEQPRLTTACTIDQCGYRETLLHMFSIPAPTWTPRPICSVTVRRWTAMTRRSSPVPPWQWTAGGSAPLLCPCCRAMT